MQWRKDDYVQVQGVLLVFSLESSESIADSIHLVFFRQKTPFLQLLVFLYFHLVLYFIDLTFKRSVIGVGILGVKDKKTGFR